MPEALKRSERLDPQARALLEMMDAQGAPPLETQDPIEVRMSRIEPMKMLGGQLEPLGRVENLSVPGPGGNIPVRIYATDSGAVRPAMVYFHGGGFVIGNLDTHDAVCRSLAKESGAVVIAVDYRLAPEHKFPAAVDDAHAVTVWAAENAERLGIDARSIGVGGDSAGGSLATVVAMRCRDAGGPALSFQLLLYPVTDMSSFETASQRELGEGYFLTRAAMQWFTAQYIGSADSPRNPEASPLLATNVSGLPCALVITAEFDPLRDEGEAYGQRLQAAGVPVTISRYSGMIHAFISMRGVIAGAQKAIEESAAFIKSATAGRAKAAF